MAKRKGSEYAPSEAVAVVSSSPSWRPSMSNVAASLSSLSLADNHKNEQSLSWEASLQMMSDLLQFYDGLGSSNDAAAARECLLLNAEFERKKEDVLRQSEAVKDRIKARIQESLEARRSESVELQRHESHLLTLEHELLDLRRRNEDLLLKKTDSEQRIHQYRTEAAQEIESIDQVEAQKISEVPRLKHQISLYASTTGIKWDYSREDVLAGEVDVAPKCVHKTFVFDPDEYSQFQIANSLWNMMDGKAPLVKPSQT